MSKDAKHTPGPLVARRVNDLEKPFAVINPNGPCGDDMVAGFLSEGDAVLYAAAPDMLEIHQDSIEIIEIVLEEREAVLGEEDEVTRDLLRRIREVVAKAEGRT